MNIISAEEVSYQLADGFLFKDLTLGLNHGDRIALIGANGCGKSTLLSILAGKRKPHSGLVSQRRDLKIEYLKQEPELKPELSIVENLLDSTEPKALAVKAFHTTEAALKANHTAENENLHHLAIEKMSELDAWNYESYLVEILSKLGIDDLTKPIGILSGGQKRRVALAKVLAAQPDVLLLDEPTNHLDIEAIEWLEAFLSQKFASLIVVTHDRYFLDNIANTIIEINNGKAQVYRGNYTYFLEQKALLEEVSLAEHQKDRKQLSKELEWMRRQPKARGTKAKSRIDDFYQLEDKTKGFKTKETLQLDVKFTRQGSKIVNLYHIFKSYGDLKLIEDFSYSFLKGEKIGIVGRNGTGKSTLLDIVVGNTKPDVGKIETGLTTVFGYYSQKHISVSPTKKVIDVVQDVAEVIEIGSGKKLTASQFLSMFLFDPKKQHDFVEKLSGGEKRRLQLLLVLIKNPNFIILDEPTNDLDITTLNVLEDYLEQFKGNLLIVSHDRYFIDRIADRVFAFEGEGKIRDFPGNFTDYKEAKANQKEGGAKSEAPKMANPTPVQAPKTDKTKTKLSFKEQRELEQLSADIERLEQEIADIKSELAGGTADYQRLTDLGEMMIAKQAELDAKTDRWLELSDV